MVVDLVKDPRLVEMVGCVVSLSGTSNKVHYGSGATGRGIFNKVHYAVCLNGNSTSDRDDVARLLKSISLPASIFGAFFVSAVAVADDRVSADFENHIRPVLIESCFRCHGDAKSSGGLRVDSRDALIAGGDSGPAIVPGSASDSLIVKAIRRHEEVSAMPPEKRDALRPEQIIAFETWIAAGAPWPANAPKFMAKKHWAFEPVRVHEPPSAEEVNAETNPIDGFLTTNLGRSGFSGYESADKRTLLRRATFDLTGLPPTPSEVEAFLSNDSPDAFQRVIDRLLESPRYGERWGRHWLDVVRYADTAGETADYPVPTAWRYRNYVIDAFNQDKPYDQFVREQIAGDILATQGPAEKYAEQIVATGYLALSRRFGFDSENYHHLTIQDTIDTLGQSVLGLSLGCARCHDHKFDAVSMKDYYGLYAIFDSSRYAFPGSEQKQKFRALVPMVAPGESHKQWLQFERRVAALTTLIEKAKLPIPSAVVRSLNEIDGDFELQAPAAGGSNGVLVPPWHYQGKVAVTHSAQSPFRNLYLGGKVGVSIARGIGNYRIFQSIPQRLSNSGRTLHVNLDFRLLSGDHTGTGAHRIWLGDLPSKHAIQLRIDNDSICVGSDSTWERVANVTPNEWQNMQLKIDLEKQTLAGILRSPNREQRIAERTLLVAGKPSFGCFVVDAFLAEQTDAPGLELDNIGVQDEEFSSPLDTPAGQVASSELDPEMIKREGEQALAELKTLLTEGPCEMAYAVTEGTPHSVAIQMRGEPSQPGVLVPRGLIRVLEGESLADDVPGSGRLELARWITRPDHPLTARVMINRIWQNHFGRGLVKTPNDFGVRGMQPTHPELLDYLAHEFVNSGWSIKAMHRLIMTSAAYQRASHAGEGQTNMTSGSSDSYERFPSRRLSAEEIRDSILFVSGELDAQVGQGHPFPSPLQWGYTQHAPFIAVYDHNQRSVYLMTQRLKRHPYLALFDGPDPNATTAERLGTTVPTQALFFLNDPFVHDKANAWAERLRRYVNNEEAQIELAYQMAFSRKPLPAERVDAIQFLSLYRTELASLDGKSETTSAMSALLRALVGSNEFLYVD